MDFQPLSFKWFCAARTAVLTGIAAFGLAAAFGATAGTAPLLRGGLAYDEVTKLVSGDQSPQPGSFASDFQAALDAQRSMADTGKHHGLFGSIMNAADMAKGAVSLLRTGTASTRYYLGNWERTDDLAVQTATITKPDQHQIIYLNIAKKTYRMVDTNAQPVSETPAPYERANNPQGQAPQPGSGKLEISVSSSMLGPKMVEDVPTTGYKMTFKMTESRSTGSCVDGTFQTSMTQYVSRYQEPRATLAGVARRSSMPRPEKMALRPGCSPSISMHTASGPSAPRDRLAMWTLVTLSGSAQSAQGTMGGGFSTLIERGHVRSLGPSDAKLFDIPADYTKEQ